MATVGVKELKHTLVAWKITSEKVSVFCTFVFLMFNCLKCCYLHVNCRRNRRLILTPTSCSSPSVKLWSKYVTFVSCLSSTFVHYWLTFFSIMFLVNKRVCIPVAI